MFGARRESKKSQKTKGHVARKRFQEMRRERKDARTYLWPLFSPKEIHHGWITFSGSVSVLSWEAVYKWILVFISLCPVSIYLSV